MKLPRKYQDKIAEVYRDSDGWWAHTRPGFYFAEMGCHTAHESSQRDLLAVIRSVTRCACLKCVV